MCTSDYIILENQKNIPSIFGCDVEEKRNEIKTAVQISFYKSQLSIS